MVDIKMKVKCPKCNHEFEVVVGKHILTIVRTGLRVEIHEPDEVTE